MHNRADVLRALKVAGLESLTTLEAITKAVDDGSIAFPDKFDWKKSWNTPVALDIEDEPAVDPQAERQAAKKTAPRSKADDVNKAMGDGNAKPAAPFVRSERERAAKRYERNTDSVDPVKQSVYGSADEVELVNAYIRLKATVPIGWDYAEKANDMAVVKALTGSDFLSAGSLVQGSIADGLTEIADRFGVAQNVAGVTPMTEGTLDFHRWAADPVAAWQGEIQATSESDPDFDRYRLFARNLNTLVRASNNILNDSAINLGDTVVRLIGRAHNKKIDEAYFAGAGTTAFGGFKGVIGTMTTTGTNPEDNAGLQIASGDTWAEITLDDIYNMMGLMRDFEQGGNNVFVCHMKFYWQVLTKFMDRIVLGATGIARSGVDIAARPAMTFLGYPVFFSNAMPTASTGTSARDTVPLLFGDFPRATKLGKVNGGISIATSEHRYFEQGLFAIRSDERVGINCHDVGTSSVAGPVVGLIMDDA